MTVILVHGVPDTASMWDPLRDALHAQGVDAVGPTALRLPGFGAPVPSGFDATKESYAAWLTGEVARAADASGAPIDVVGHDWGSILVQHLVGTRPELVRTWACGSGPVDRAYVWHDTAQLFQTPEIGEQVAAAMTPDALGAFLAEELGEERARAAAGAVDDTMKRCILALYRSAVTVGDEWEDVVTAGASTRPGLVLWGAHDGYAPAECGERLATRTGAELVVFEQAAHWWPVTEAGAAARLLAQHWGRP